MLALIMQNLASGFHDFIKDAESSYIAQVSQKLTDYYQANGTWQPLKEDERSWHRLVGDPRKVRDNHTLALPTDTSGISQLLQTPRRLSLYNANKVVVVGRPRMTENQFSQAIEINGEIVGWLSFIPSRLAEHSPANDFLAQQYQSYIAITLSVVALAFVMAWFFSRHLVAPISRINQGTTQLIQGELSTRVINKTNDELGELTQNVNILAQTLEKNKSERSKWMSDVAHELKTPLTVVRGQLNAIQDGIFEPDERRLQVMIDQIDSMGHLVGDIYQLSITDIGGLSYKKASLDLVALLKNLAFGFKVKTDALGLSLDYSHKIDNKRFDNKKSDNKKCLVMADRERLTQLFSNILENSCRYTDAPGVIALSLKAEKACFKVFIEDSSPSIPSSDFTKVFDRFYRIEPSRNREHGGSGIGLALCKQIIEAHQGTITADRSEYGGVKIVVTVPRQKHHLAGNE